MSSQPARDGETLSGEQVRIFRETFSQPESEVERLVLRLCDTVAALRAELADARAVKGDTEDAYTELRDAVRHMLYLEMVDHRDVAPEVYLEAQQELELARTKLGELVSDDPDGCEY